MVCGTAVGSRSVRLSEAVPEESEVSSRDLVRRAAPSRRQAEPPRQRQDVSNSVPPGQARSAK